MRLFRDPQGQLPQGRRAAVFALTWLSYASYYLARKNFAVVKARLHDTLALSTDRLGDIDTGYLAAYAAGQFLSGFTGDRVGARRLVGWGMILAALTAAAFGAGSTALIFALAFAVNGLAQSTGWPGNVKAMAGWFGPGERGTVMGIWATNYQVGGLVATALATLLLTRIGWRAAFFFPALWVAGVGLLILFFLPERGVPGAASGPAPAPEAEPAVRSLDVLRMPVIWSIGAAYFCLKLIRYSILFWLPYYLNEVLHYPEKEAGYLSTSFEAGGVVGAIVIGLLTDRYFPTRKRELSSWTIVGLAGALFLYARVAPLGAVPNFAAMALVGFCLFGPDALISGAAAQDLGGASAAATAAGMIDGMGSIGAVLQGRVTTGVSHRFGWEALYYLFVALALVAAVALRSGGSPKAGGRSSASGRPNR